MNVRGTLRNSIRRRLLPACGVRRVHIVGCARSGTTMLHYAMIAFENTRLSEVESSIRFYPGIGRSISLATRALRSGVPLNFITKRNYGWFEAEALRETVNHIITERIGIINIVRDPRDVLTSKHAGDAGNADLNHFYVAPERWHLSVAAGEYLIKSVANYVPAITLRYEDLVQYPDQAEAMIAQTFGLSKRPELDSIADLKENIRTVGLPTKNWMTKALHTVRNFDQQSVSRWQTNPEQQGFVENLVGGNDNLGHALRQFISRYSY